MNRRAAFAFALLGLTGCGTRPEAGPPAAALPSPTPKVEVETPYKIIADWDEGPGRREVEVKLRKKVTAEVLRQIALEVKARELRPHDRTAIFYHLPADFPENAGQPWASTHFRPALEVKILGLSPEEEEALRKVPLDHKGSRIGAWLQDDQYKTLDLIYNDGSPKLAEIRSPTDRIDSELVEVTSPTGRTYRKVKGSNLYVVDLAGNLRICNAGGQVIAAARPLK